MLARFKASAAAKKKFGKKNAGDATTAQTQQPADNGTSSSGRSKKRKRPKENNVSAAGQENWMKLLKKKNRGPMVHYGTNYEGKNPHQKAKKNKSKHKEQADKFSLDAAPTTNLKAKHTKKQDSDVPDKKVSADKNKYIAMDCEMVGVGSDGKRSVLARCSLVDYDEETVYDKFVQCVEHITDFRTEVSGVRPKDVKRGIPFTQCQLEVAAILKGKILLGHALHNDLKALLLKHPRHLIRDTAGYKPMMKLRRPRGHNPSEAGKKLQGKLKPRALRELSRVLLGEIIQEGEHSSVIDARTGVRLYSKYRHQWERGLKTNVWSPIMGLDPNRNYNKPSNSARANSNRPSSHSASSNSSSSSSSSGDGADAGGRSSGNPEAGTGAHDFFSGASANVAGRKGGKKRKALPMSNLVM